MAQGCFVKSVPDPKSTAYHHLGISLNPSPVPVDLYNNGIKIERVMGILYANLCRDYNLIYEILSTTKDPFILRLLEVAKASN